MSDTGTYKTKQKALANRKKKSTVVMKPPAFKLPITVKPPALSISQRETPYTQLAKALHKKSSDVK